MIGSSVFWQIFQLFPVPCLSQREVYEGCELPAHHGHLPARAPMGTLLGTQAPHSPIQVPLVQPAVWWLWWLCGGSWCGGSWCGAAARGVSPAEGAGASLGTCRRAASTAWKCCPQPRLLLVLVRPG